MTPVVFGVGNDARRGKAEGVVKKNAAPAKATVCDLWQVCPINCRLLLFDTRRQRDEPLIGNDSKDMAAVEGCLAVSSCSDGLWRHASSCTGAARRPSRGKVLRVSAVGEETCQFGDSRGRRDAAVLHDAECKCELAFLADVAPHLAVLKPRLREEGSAR